MKIIVIDLETTGLNVETDEILQVSIIDGKYNTLLNTYCRPLYIKEWEASAKVHGITPDMVKDKLPFKEYIKRISDIMNEADRIVCYNGKSFDLVLLERYGIEIDYSKVYDLMLEIDKVYNKWFKLIELADFYGYEFKAHDSLEDVKATLYCYYKFKKEQSNAFFDNRSIDFIIDHLNNKDKGLEIAQGIQQLTMELDSYNRFVGVRARVKKYNVNLLFNKNNNLVDSQCDCMDCLDGGNRLCKHVVAALICLKNNNVDVYMEKKRETNTYLNKCRQRTSSKEYVKEIMLESIGE